MRHRRPHMLLKFAMTILLAINCHDINAKTGDVGTGNPYLPLWEHVPDGEPRVFEDPDNPGQYRIYVVGSHDTMVSYYCGYDTRMWSAPIDDLTNWRDEGAIFTYQIDGKWDVMYAPDLVEVIKKDGTKEYYLYPNNQGNQRTAMVCKGKRPDGPFTPINMNEDGRQTTGESILGFDPAVYIEEISNPQDPDYATGFRIYGYWGFQRSQAAQLDPVTMCSVKPGTEEIPYFIPASTREGEILDPKGTEYPALYEGEDLHDFNFFEASSIRKVGNKYVMIFSGYSGPEYGLEYANSTLRYAYGDSPLGPWRNGGILVDTRGVVPSQDGSHLQATNAAHNTHGSLQEINNQWYVFYHRPPRGFGYARQAMVAPVTIQCDEKSVAEGGKVVIRAYDPYATNNIWQSEATNGDIYTGAEVTSEGFQLFGLPPYKYYSAGYACYLSNNGSMQDNWDIWDDNMPVNVSDGDIVGFKYFGFGGLDESQKGLKPFEGTREGNQTKFNLFLTPQSEKSFKISVWLDGPWDNETWKGKKIGEIVVPENADAIVTKYTIDVAKDVDGLDKKHALFLVAEGEGNLCILRGLGFSKEGMSLEAPVVPQVSIALDGVPLELPTTPMKATGDNGITDYQQYEVTCPLSSTTTTPKVTATASNPSVKVSIQQPEEGKAIVKFDYEGAIKTYNILLTPTKKN